MSGEYFTELDVIWWKFVAQILTWMNFFLNFKRWQYLLIKHLRNGFLYHSQTLTWPAEWWSIIGLKGSSLLFVFLMLFLNFMNHKILRKRKMISWYVKLTIKIIKVKQLKKEVTSMSMDRKPWSLWPQHGRPGSLRSGIRG